MPGKSSAGSAEPNVSRKMSDEQCKIVFDAFISAPPIGGKTDGLMGKKSKEVEGANGSEREAQGRRASAC
jgi:hypothetical protein